MNRLSETAQRYIKVMIVGIILDLGGYIIAHFAHLPVWLDANGTAYAAMMLEPTAGFLVAFFVSFFKAAFVYTSKDLIAYCLSASVAIIFGVGMRKMGQIELKRLLPMSALFVLVNTILGYLVALWQGGVISGWEGRFMEMVASAGTPAILAELFGVFVLKAGDAVIMAIVLYIAYQLTPKAWINDINEPTVSWDTPYFTKK